MVRTYLVDCVQCAMLSGPCRKIKQSFPPTGLNACAHKTPAGSEYTAALQEVTSWSAADIEDASTALKKLAAKTRTLALKARGSRNQKMAILKRKVQRPLFANVCIFVPV